MQRFQGDATAGAPATLVDPATGLLYALVPEGGDKGAPAPTSAPCHEAWLDEWLTVAQAASELHVRESAVRRWCKDGLLPSAMLPGRERGRRVQRRAVMAFMEGAVANG